MPFPSSARFIPRPERKTSKFSLFISKFSIPPTASSKFGFGQLPRLKKKEGKHSRCGLPWFQGLRLLGSPSRRVGLYKARTGRRRKKIRKKKKVVGSGDNHKASTMGCSPVVFDYLVGQTSDYSSVIVAIEDLKDLHAKLAENDHAGLTCWCIRISNRLHWK